MDDAHLLEMYETLNHLIEYLSCISFIEGWITLDEVIQILPFNMLKYDIELLFIFNAVDELDYVRMRADPQHVHLPQEIL